MPRTVNGTGQSFGGMRVVSEALDVRGLAMLGAVPTGEWTDLSDRHRDLEVLNVLASEDAIASPKKARGMCTGTGLSQMGSRNYRSRRAA